MKMSDDPSRSSVIGEASSSTLPTTAGRGRGRRRSSTTSGRSTFVREHTTSSSLTTPSENLEGHHELNTHEDSAPVVEPQRIPSEINNPVDSLDSSSTARAETPSASFITSPWSNQSDDDDDDDSLPEFWEKVHLPDGETLYLDHRTQTTSWERPPQTTRFRLTDPDESWAARLQAPLPEVPEVDNYSTRAREGPWSDVAPSILSHDHDSLNTQVVADLLRDGYTLGDRSTDDFSQPGAVPDFWEVRRGTDGHTYYIDHPASIILRSR